MSIRVVNAGDGYAYLLRSVATADQDTGAKTKLGDYYAATGTPPGRWYGKGLSLLDSSVVRSGSTVVEEHMAALYGEGLHPEADAQITAGASIADVQLGRAYPIYTGGDEVLKAIQVAEKDFRYTNGYRPTEEERNTIALRIARPAHEEEFGYRATPKEILAWVNEKKNSIRQATAGFDMTFSPVKSVSVLWALGDERTREAIQKIHGECVNDTLEWVENNALFTRCEVGGIKQLTRTGGMIAAQFVHYDTRSGDPDLHTHCLISNKVQGPDGKWRSVDSRSLLKSAVTASTHYDSLMMQRLSDELGLRFAPRTTGETTQPVWEIAGVDARLLEQFSKRREGARPRFQQLCDEYREQHGRHPGSRAARKLWQQAILDTRPSKDEAKSLEQLRRQWAAECAATFGEEVAAHITDNCVSASEERLPFPSLPNTDEDAETWNQTVTDYAHKALELATSRRATFKKTHLTTAVEQTLAAFTFDDLDHRSQATAAVLDHALATAVHLTPAQPLALPGRLLTEEGLPIDRHSSEITYTTEGVLGDENTVIESAFEPTAHLVTDAEVRDGIQRHAAANGFELNTGQAALARHLLTTGAQTAAGVGPAGTGKTASMAVVADVWRRAGHNVIALAPSAVAAQTLGTDIGGHGHTLASLTYRWRGIVGETPRSVASLETELGHAINPGDMLLVDEAGMATTADLAAIAEIARETGAIVRMVGDPYQLDAVETGGLFRTICTRTHAVELDQVMRQGDDTDQAEAGLELRQGNAAGLDLYAERGWIHGGTRPEMVDAAVDAWLTDFDRGRKTLLVASTNDAVNEANTRIQQALINRGHVHARPGWLARLLRKTPPTVALGDGANAFIGDVILARRNESIDQPDGTRRRVLNGQRLTVKTINNDGSVVVHDSEKHRPLTLSADYVQTHCQLGYASTIHRSQGVTVDTTHAVVDNSTDRRGLYVALTRGKTENKVWAVVEPRIDEGEEEAHLHMDGDSAPETAVEMLTRIVATDSGHTTATDIAATISEEEHSPTRLRTLFHQAVTALAHDYADTVTAEVVDYLPVDVADHFDDNDVAKIRASVTRAARAGIDIRPGLADLTELYGNEEDIAAVIAHRIDCETTSTELALPPVTADVDTDLHSCAVALQQRLREIASREENEDKGTTTAVTVTNTAESNNAVNTKENMTDDTPVSPLRARINAAMAQQRADLAKSPLTSWSTRDNYATETPTYEDYYGHDDEAEY